MTTVTISLPESLRDFVDSQVKTRGYGNVSEYFRGLLRTAQEQESDRQIERFLLAGLDSGRDIELNPKYWSKKRASIVARIGQNQPKRKKQRPK
jgi:antitoxin ParD1/3/4